MRRLITITACFAALSITSSCTKDFVEAESVDGPVSFSTDIEPMLKSNCGSCHGTSAMGGLDIVTNTYQTLMDGYVTAEKPDESSLYTKLQDGHQKPSASDMAKLKAWIEQGAEDN